MRLEKEENHNLLGGRSSESLAVVERVVYRRDAGHWEAKVFLFVLLPRPSQCKDVEPGHVFFQCD